MITLQDFQRQRLELLERQPQYRQICPTCRQPVFACYCAHIRRFDPRLKFVILIHPIEQRRRIATGRMASLCLENAELIRAQDYSQNKRVNELMADPLYQPFVLYPGRHSVNLSLQTPEEKQKMMDSHRIPLIFVIDGTWATARKTMRASENLAGLPRICFTPPGPSQFRIRKQPGKECYSTIEAVHHTIELLAELVNFPLRQRAHDNLLSVFNAMVERQISCMVDGNGKPLPPRYRPRKRRSTGPGPLSVSQVCPSLSR